MKNSTSAAPSRLSERLLAALALSGLALSGLALSGPGQAANPAANSAANESDTLQDYRYQMPLTTAAKQGVLALPLPQTLYLHAQSLQLNDVRIFDAKGQKVPIALLPAGSTSLVTRASFPVKIFPLRGGAGNGAANSGSNNVGSGGNVEMDVKTDANGSVISVKTKSGTSGANNKITHLVLDARNGNNGSNGTKGSMGDGPKIEGLRFRLPAATSSYNAQVWLDVSDDLQHWDTIGTAELSWLVNSGSETLANDRLSFEARSFRYARLSWRAGEPIEFAGIEALTVSQQSNAPQLESVLLEPLDGKQAGDLVYQASAALPVVRVNLQFRESNVVYPAAIGGYQEIPAVQIGKANTWHFEAQMRSTFYQITQDGKTRRSGELALPQPTGMNQWVVRPQQAGSSRPTMVLSWQAANLVFLNSGNGPYTLAYGRADAKAGLSELEQVAPGFSTKELQQLAQAQTGAEQLTATPKQLQQQQSAAQAASDAAKTRSFALWGVLILGVLVLAGMAWSLVKQFKAGK